MTKTYECHKTKKKVKKNIGIDAPMCVQTNKQRNVYIFSVSFHISLTFIFRQMAIHTFIFIDTLRICTWVAVWPFKNVTFKACFNKF